MNPRRSVFWNLVDLDSDQPSFFGQDWKEKKLFSGPLRKNTWCFLWAFCWRLHFASSSSGSLAHRDDEHRRWWIFYIEILPQLSKTGTKNLNCESVSSSTNTTRSQWIWNFFKDLCAKLHTMALQHLLVAKFRWKALEIGHQKCIGWPQWRCLFISIYIYIIKYIYIYTPYTIYVYRSITSGTFLWLVFDQLGPEKIEQSPNFVFRCYPVPPE